MSDVNDFSKPEDIIAANTKTDQPKKQRKNCYVKITYNYVTVAPNVTTTRGYVQYTYQATIVCCELEYILNLWIIFSVSAFALYSVHHSRAEQSRAQGIEQTCAAFFLGLLSVVVGVLDAILIV